MPTYDYECTQCKYKFDLFQPMTSKPVAQCPECSGLSKRIISGGAGILFKGSGFYVTDYKKKEANKATKETPKETPAKETPAPAKDKSSSDTPAK